jgi:Sucrase/ferredoxin-like
MRLQPNRPQPGPAVQRPAVQPPVFGCEHGAACHDGAEPAVGTAPEQARSWLLIEHDGPWPAEVADVPLPGVLADLAAGAEEAGLRVQLIRRPGRRSPGASGAAGGTGRPAAVFVGWAAGSSPWLLRGDAAAAGELCAQLAGLPDGVRPSFGRPAAEPLYLVCAHGRRDVCCARFGVPLARALGAAHPAEVWETTHVGGHRYAANLVILPHALYYGPVDQATAAAAIAAYRRGEIAPGRYRGRAGQPHGEQEKRYQRMVEAGTFGLGELG